MECIAYQFKYLGREAIHSENFYWRVNESDFGNIAKLLDADA